MRVFRSLVEEAPQLLLVLAADVRCAVLYANNAAAGALAVPRPALLGRCVRWCWGVVGVGDLGWVGFEKGGCIGTSMHTPLPTN